MNMVKRVEINDGSCDLDSRSEAMKKIPCLSCDTNSCSYASMVLPSAKSLLAFLGIFILCAVVYSSWINTPLDGNLIRQLSWNAKQNIFSSHFQHPHLSCPKDARVLGCGARPQVGPLPLQVDTVPPLCPEYFRWIHEDLKPWRGTGITREMVQRARKYAHFRLVVVQGRVYVKQYGKCFQTRDEFTLWGMVQLLRLPGRRLPDLDLMFDCNDTPKIKAEDFRPAKEGAPPPPPLFRYCGDNSTVEIVFPDWTFWGWPETNIKPWETLFKELKEGNRMRRWLDREPYAFWKGNPNVSPSRMDLLNCNIKNGHDWKARLFVQDWGKESKKGFKESNLASQCTYRYKIYIEGAAWSVSEKYILACDSPCLVVKPRYYDFFSRGLMPLHHYWPINGNHKCSSIQFAVEWGNNHTHKAQLIGKEGSGFIEEKLAMKNVYDYMFHILNEYSKLLTYKPTVPKGAEELCLESMLCRNEGLAKSFMLDSMVDHHSSSSKEPSCTLPPPLEPDEMEMLLNAKAYSMEQVEAWERRRRPMACGETA